MAESRRELLTFFEVDQPFCSRIYGDGVDPFFVDGADFDGSNDYLQLGQGLAGVADSKKGILSAWIRFDGGDGAAHRILGLIRIAGGIQDDFRFVKLTTNVLQLVAANAALSNILDLRTISTFIASTAWRHVLISWDMAVGSHLYVDDVSDKNQVTFTDDIIDYTKSDVMVGAQGDGTQKFNGALAEFYFAPGQYLDFSIEENRRKFINSLGEPVSLGSNGSLPTGVPPAIYLHLDDGEAVGNFSNNRATTDDFAIVGSLDTASSSPSDGAIGEGCHAALGITGTRKCFNTRFTCQDPPAYDPQPLTLRFAQPQADLLQYGNVIPSLASLSTTPGSINLAGMDSSASALGKREVVTARLIDHKHSDHLVDKYRLERPGGTPGVGNYLSLPGTSGNYASTPDSAAVSITGDIDIRVKLAADDWTPSSNGGLLGSYGGGQNRVALQLHNGTAGGVAGQLDLSWSTTGANWVNSFSTVAVGPIDGAIKWVRATLDVDNGAVGRDIKFYTSDDGVTWTQLGATVTQAGVTSIFNSTNPFEIGSLSIGTTNLFAGKIYYAELRNGIDGPVVAKFDPDETFAGDTAFPSSTGEVWTIHQNGSPAAEIIGAPDPLAYDPYERGTFWGKWIARNPYYSAYRCRVRDGHVGDALSAMRVRNYIIDRVEGPSEGSVTIIAKDLFSVIEARKAHAPLASEGELLAAITAVSGSATLAPSGIGNLGYPASGHVAIGDEVVAFTRSGDALTLTERGAFDTTAADHDAEDLVQLVLSYVTQRVEDIIYDLLINYSAVDPATISISDWDLAAADISTLYTARIVKPTPVNDLLGELSEQAGITLYHDVETDEIRLVPLRAQAATATVNDRDWILEGSLGVKRQDARRISQVWVYYGLRNPVEDLDDRRNYHSRAVVTDLEAADLYGAHATREVFSRWIPQFGRQAAIDTGNRILAMFRDPPLEAEFSIDASREGKLVLAGAFDLKTSEVQDDTGAEATKTMAVVELERDESEIRVRAQGVEFFTPAGAGARVIYIENDGYNLNLRAIHDSLFAAPVGGSNGEIVQFVVSADVLVGSTSASSPAIDTGDWPAGVELSLDLALGRVQGKGGRAGDGGERFQAGNAGEAGGTALKARYAITVNMQTGASEGELWGGGGGGGGGAGAANAKGGGGGGGGGAAGTDPGAGGIGKAIEGVSGAAGTATTGGAGGAGGPNHGFGAGGAGGAGGGPGLAGTAGTAASGGAGGAAGAAGKYIEGIAFVTFTTNGEGDLRGGTS